MEGVQAGNQKSIGISPTQRFSRYSLRGVHQAPRGDLDR